MNTGFWRSQCEFVVSRRVPWGNDEGLRPHIDRVVDALRLSDAAAEIEIDADLETARVALAVVVAVDEDGDGATIAREHVGAAIRACGGRHEDLLPLADESRLESRSNPWSGLRIPLWTLHRTRGEWVMQD